MRVYLVWVGIGLLSCALLLAWYSWLFECAVAQKIVPVGPHLLPNRPLPPPDSECGDRPLPTSDTEGAKRLLPPLDTEEAPPPDTEGADVEMKEPLHGVVMCFSVKLASLSCEC